MSKPENTNQFRQQQQQASAHSFTWQRQYGGGGGQPAPPPVRSTPPPPTTNDASVRQAREDALRQERMRKGRKATILAAGFEYADRAMAAQGSAKSGSGANATVLGGA